MDDLLFAQETGKAFTTLACLVIPLGLLLFTSLIAIIGTYTRMGKLVKLMETAVYGKRKK